LLNGFYNTIKGKLRQEVFSYPHISLNLWQPGFVERIVQQMAYPGFRNIGRKAGVWKGTPALVS
jgi:hypothetical protein